MKPELNNNSLNSTGDGTPNSCKGQSRIKKETLRIEKLAQAAVQKEIVDALANGYPVARYDLKKKAPYLEYPDGHREYTDSK